LSPKNIAPELTLARVAAEPELVTTVVELPGGESALFRPLMPEDDVRLAQFLKDLSPLTRRFSTFSGYDLTAAREMCEAINRYDKLRLVVQGPAEPSGRLIALFEFSFAITTADQQRFRAYGINLDARTDCRFGPTIADEYQNQGLGNLLFPHIVDIARRFGQTRVILWGGVFARNGRAIRYYEKNGFRRLGVFNDADGVECYDMMLEIKDP
jgi:GNAT superfamily N-acetyltransferase